MKSNQEPLSPPHSDKKPLILAVDTTGKIRTIYSDELADLMSEGKCVTQRASHVEPREDGQWYAEIIGGPVLGPFKLRGDALDAEVEYLQREVLK